MSKLPGRTRLERETSIIFNDAEGTASIWTFSPSVQSRLSSLGHRPNGANVAGPYILEKSLITIRRAKRKSAISQASIDALRKAREARKLAPGG
jgi:hypothetical protein